MSTLVGLTLFALIGTASAQTAAPPALPPPSAAAPAPAAPVVPPATDLAVAQAPAAGQPAETRRKLQVGLSFLPMAKGKYIQSASTVSVVKAEAAFAYGFGLSVGYEVLPGLIVGLAPQYILHVKEKAPEIDYAPQKEIDLLARVAYVLTLADKTAVFAEVLPGYSLIQNDSGPKGFVLAAGIGAIMDMTDRVFVSLGAGYQMGFQSFSEGPVTFQNRTRYVRVALTGGVKF